jgi:hypothetical protein
MNFFLVPISLARTCTDRISIMDGMGWAGNSYFNPFAV